MEIPTAKAGCANGLADSGFETSVGVLVEPKTRGEACKHRIIYQRPPFEAVTVAVAAVSPNGKSTPSTYPNVDTRTTHYLL
jgi:hypothetical protein